jgi:hypothetical protein
MVETMNLVLIALIGLLLPGLLLAKELVTVGRDVQ